MNINSAANHKPKANMHIDMIMDKYSNLVEPNMRARFTDSGSLYSSIPNILMLFL